MINLLEMFACNQQQSFLLVSDQRKAKLSKTNNLSMWLIKAETTSQFDIILLSNMLLILFSTRGKNYFKF